VVDDHPENRLPLLQLIESVGFEVRGATNGEEAIALWQTWHPHVIWMDMRMPVMDGYEATRHIKAHPDGAETVIIALTASAFEEQQDEILSAGCDDFICKPFRDYAIFDCLAHHLNVRYLYQEPPKGNTVYPGASSLNLNTNDMQSFAPPWRKRLYDAAVQADADLILQLIDDITDTLSPEQQVIAQSLKYLAQQFCFDEIIALMCDLC
jgi:CheY-like chemotaxis protein